METKSFSPSPSESESSQGVVQPIRPVQKVVWPFLILALFAGLVGGVFSPVILQELEQKVPALKGLFQEPARESTLRVLMEDEAVASLVEKNASGVVSIVISKNVSNLRNTNPFGFPFFSVPSPSVPDETIEKQKIGSGSGFFVTADGLIVTNKHVVSDEQAEYLVKVSGGEEYPAKVLARDPNNDIALLKIEGNDFPVLKLGDSDMLKVGQTAIAIGNPLGEFANSVSRGIVSGVERNVSAGSVSGDTERLSGIIQTDAAINPGNSGGPLFNISGEVIGVNVAMAQGAENIGFALPINQVKRIVDQVRETGKISTPYIGVRYIVLNDKIKKESNLPYNYGALVLRGQNITDFSVIPGSPADKAGIVENDIILEVGGKKVDEEHSLANLLGSYTVGDEVTLKVWHKGDTKDIKIKLEERQQ